MWLVMERRASGEKIKQARMKAGLSQEALARALEVSVFTVSRYERGAVGVSDARLKQLAEALGVGPEELT